jgi:hypothetical protein
MVAKLGSEYTLTRPLDIAFFVFSDLFIVSLPALSPIEGSNLLFATF